MIHPDPITTPIASISRQVGPTYITHSHLERCRTASRRNVAIATHQHKTQGIAKNRHQPPHIADAIVGNVNGMETRYRINNTLQQHHPDRVMPIILRTARQTASSKQTHDKKRIRHGIHPSMLHQVPRREVESKP